jgi:colanic acid/amylovoran biosynthesis protein
MQEIITKVGRGNNRIKLAPNFLNAVQLKYVLSKCTYFIGARTHATIGAISSLIPTISIAYSIKAKGINLDLFGNEDFILEASSIDRASLRKSYLKLVENKDQIEAMLIKRIPEWCERTHLSAMWLSRTLVNVRNCVE